MVAEVANTTISVLRGTRTNKYGDEVPSGAVYLSGIPAFIGETGRKVQDPSTNTPRTIREVTGQVPSWCGILNTDQIADERTGDEYMVLSVTQPPTLFGDPSMFNDVLQLKRITGTGM